MIEVSEYDCLENRHRWGYLRRAFYRKRFLWWTWTREYAEYECMDCKKKMKQKLFIPYCV